MIDETMDDEEREEDALEEEEDAFDGVNLEGDFMEWCPKCGDIKPHVQIDDTGLKLKCVICNCEHVREEGEDPVKQSLLSDEDKASDEALHNAWRRLSDVPQEDIIPYSIHIKPEPGNVIRHSKFGIGVVIELNDASKAEVLFQDGLKRLVCGK